MWYFPSLAPFAPVGRTDRPFIAGSYAKARQAFLGDAAALSAKMQSFPVGAPAAGLFVDTALIGARHAPNVLVVVCGVHGVEGYAGSACMNYLMRHYDAASIAPDTAVLLVHALNPWGFAHDSRATEHNVDLNRNFIDFDAPPPANAAYARLHPALCEHFRPGIAGLPNEVKLFALALGAGGQRRLRDGITAGQYAHPRGLFYGGVARAENRAILEDILDMHLPHAKQVRLIDIHTGLGRFGAGHLLSHRARDDTRFIELNGWLDGQLAPLPCGSALSPAISGTLPAFVEARLGAECHALTLAFGVTTPLRALYALRLDNWLRGARLRGAIRPDIERHVRRQMRGAFLSPHPVWERSILLRFCWTATRMLASLSASRIPC